MTRKQPYHYVILRYVHDVMTSEFVNVGVVVYAPEERALRWKMRHTIGRLGGAFPDLDRVAFQTMMRTVTRGFVRISKRSRNGLLFETENSLARLIREALPSDDSSLQWSTQGAGYTANVRETFDQLYER